MYKVFKNSYLGVFLVCFLHLILISCSKDNINEIDDVGFTSVDLPHMKITTENSASIESKTTYISAKIAIAGGKEYPNYSGSGKIMGRGNYSWIVPKKPYKIKFDYDTGLFNLPPEKDWVLLANFLDGSHLLSSVSLKIGKLLGLPYTNNYVPFELTVNGNYRGLYGFTEQIEVKENRVNVGKGGVLLLLDTNYDDPWKFRSFSYNLPVMIKYPEIIESSEILPIRTDFDKLERLVARADFPDNNYLDYLDADAMANYFLVYFLTCNEEINHPKSTYIYKMSKGKYTMGPIWDFDWAYSYEQSQKQLLNPYRPLFWNKSSLGTKFFFRIYSDPKIKNLVRQKWRQFKADKYRELDDYILSYSKQIEKARKKDYDTWLRGNAQFSIEVENLRQWFVKRSDYLDNELE